MSTRWLTVKPWRIAFCVCHKCGSRSLVHALAREFGLTHEKKLKINRFANQRPDVFEKGIENADRCVAIIRNPEDRFKSLYKQKVLYRGNVSKIVPGLNEQVWACKTPDELIPLIEKYENGHWRRMVDHIDGNATEYILTEEFTDFWNGLNEAGNPMQPRNVTGSSDVQLSEKVRKWLREYYAADFELYNQVRMDRSQEDHGEASTEPGVQRPKGESE